MCQRFEQEGAAGLLIAEEVFAQSGVGLLRQVLERQSAWSDVPIVVFTGTPAFGRTRNSNPQLLSAIGNVILLERPLQPISMVSAARSALRARRRQYDARAELLAQQRAVRERDQFLAMLGHELRNPLSAISMALKLDNATHASKYQDVLNRQVAHVTRLVDDLLDVARVTSGKIVLRCDDVDLVALTQRCIALLHPSLENGTSLTLDCPDEQVWIYADAVRIEQVVNNLVTNAIKYTGAGGQIAVQLSASNDEAILRVRDSGVGLAPGMIDRVFELFTQAEGSLDRSKGGMGIGLTLVRNLVDLHDGSVTVASAGLGQGSEFAVRLPRKTVAADSGVRVLANGQHQQDNMHHAHTDKVLIVEDNEDSRELLAAILTQRGYEVATAEDGQSGIDGALAGRPQVLLVDIGLPGIDGYGLAREVRRKLGDDVYLVALTGYGQPQDRSRAIDAGFDVHLTKPVDIDALERLLANRVAAAAAAHSV
jgi:signal transduction histidine kinase/ActR/RegA family two-component response regulator